MLRAAEWVIAQMRVAAHNMTRPLPAATLESTAAKPQMALVPGSSTEIIASDGLMQAKIVIAHMLLFLRARRRVMFAVLAVMLLVQTGFPAHEDSHPIGSKHAHCEYCVMAGHAFGAPGVAILVPPAPVYAAYQATRPIEFCVRPLPRTRFSRGPPLTSLV